MKTCLVVDDFSVIRKVARRILEGSRLSDRGSRGRRTGPRSLPQAVAGSGSARLEHAEDGWI